MSKIDSTRETPPRPDRSVLLRWGMLTVMCLLALAHSQAQIPRDSHISGPLDFDSRNLAMGSAGYGDIENTGSMYSNPATLSFLRHPGIMAVHHHNWNNHVRDDAVAARVFNNKWLAIGVGGTFSYAGLLEPRFNMEFTEYGFDLAISTKPEDFLSAGVSASYRSGTAGDSSVTGYWFSMGTVYSPGGGLSYAAALSGMGRAIAYAFDPALNRTVVTQGPEVMPALDVGASFIFPARGGPPSFFVSSSARRIFKTRETEYRIGAELIVMRLVALRIGYVSRVEDEVRYGFGIMLGRFRLDYTLMPRKDRDQFDQIGVRYNF
jgi:hypothetical protein